MQKLNHSASYLNVCIPLFLSLAIHNQNVDKESESRYWGLMCLG